MKLNLDAEKFIHQHWQKKPLYLKKGFSDFVDPMDAHELAGLALEDFVTSRVIVRKKNAWSAHPGPFSHYDMYGERDWQLLVHAVNHWVPECQDIVDAFNFLPDWRVDDLMMSFCTPGGGVGPHIDQYDVFIIQGEGKRRWQVGALGTHALRKDIKQMAIIEDFDSIIDVEMQPGDILYIPAGYPHQGHTESNEPALSYSLGFRAPLQRELIVQWADYLESNQLAATRYTSPKEETNSGIISRMDQQAMLQLMKQSLSDSASFSSMLGQLLSQSRFELNLEARETPVTQAFLSNLVEQAGALYRIGGLKIICHEQDTSRVFIDGDEYDLSGVAQDQCFILANMKFYPAALIEEWLEIPQMCDIVLDLINQGYLIEDLDA